MGKTRGKPVNQSMLKTSKPHKKAEKKSQKILLMKKLPNSVKK